MRKKLIFIAAVVLVLAMIPLSAGAATNTSEPQAKTTQTATKKETFVVKGLTAVNSNWGEVTLTWTANKKATGYEIYRSTKANKNYKLVKTITDKTRTKWVNKNRKDKKTYYYKIKAINSTGISAAVSVYIKDIPLKETVLKVKVANVGDSNQVSWNLIDDASGYIIYRSEKPDTGYKRIKVIMSNSVLFYNDNQAPSGKVCYYKVRGYKLLTLSKLNAPVSIQTKYRVYIAAGHGIDSRGKWDTGCTYSGMQEAKLMMPITEYMVKYLQQSGVYVYTDVFRGNDMNMLACVSYANKKALSAYVSIHCDYYKSPSGTYPLYVSKKGKELAQALNIGARSQVSLPTRGLKRRFDLWELNMTDTVACVFETGSIKKDYKVFKYNYKEYGKGLAKGMCNYLGVKFIDTPIA